MIRASDTSDAEKIASRLDTLGRRVHGREYVNAFEDAASAIRTLAKLCKLTAIADRDELVADKAQPGIDKDAKEMRLMLSRNEEPLAVIHMKPEFAYDLASSILDCYDKLEGIT